MKAKIAAVKITSCFIVHLDIKRLVHLSIAATLQLTENLLELELKKHSSTDFRQNYFKKDSKLMENELKKPIYA